MNIRLPKLSSKGIIILLCTSLGASLLALAVALGALFLGGDEEPVVLPPDEAYQEKDPNIEPYPDSTGDPVQNVPEGGGMASFTCEAQLTVRLSEARVDLMFANPTRSQQNMVIEVLVGEQVIAQSGRIEPGYRVTSLPLIDKEQLTQGIYQATVRIYFYHPQTGEQKVDTSVPVSLIVKN